MDGMDLLAREDEFKKLNRQLEKKSESLMRQIELVLQKQETNEYTVKTTAKHSCNPPTNTNHSYQKPLKNVTKRKDNVPEPTQTSLIKHSANELGPNVGNEKVCVCCVNVPNNDMEFLYAFVSVNVKDKTLPPSFARDNITVEKVCKFLSSKIKLLQEQIDKLQNKINGKATQCESHLTQLADLENERMTLLNKNNNMKTATLEMKAKCHSLQNRLDEKERLYTEQRSQIDRLTCEMKKIKNKSVNLEARCASYEDTIDNLKRQLDTLKINEKDLKDSIRNLSSTNQSKITTLETQINIQNKHTDRQTKLINNLRQQINILTMSGTFKVLEQEYMKLLNEE